jgi:hypothetical protein
VNKPTRCGIQKIMATGLHHKYALSRCPSRSLLLFYAYRPVLQTSSAADEANAQLSKCIELSLTGRLLVANEGINGTVGGETAACEAYVQWMCQVCASLKSFSISPITPAAASFMAHVGFRFQAFRDVIFSIALQFFI